MVLGLYPKGHLMLRVPASGKPGAVVARMNTKSISLIYSMGEVKAVSVVRVRDVEKLEIVSLIKKPAKQKASSDCFSAGLVPFIQEAVDFYKGFALDRQEALEITEYYLVEVDGSVSKDQWQEFFSFFNLE
jgi:hypothetical protein